MKKTTRKLLSLAMASAMAASLLTGCGGGGAGETTAAAGAEKTEAGKTPYGLMGKGNCLSISVSLPGRTSRSTSTVRRWKWRTVAR